MKSKTKHMLLTAALLSLIFSSAFSQGWNVELVGNIAYHNTVSDVKVQDNYAYIAQGGDCLRVIDISNPTEPFEVGYCGDSLGFSQNGAAAVSGDHAYLVLYALQIFNVSDPSNPYLESNTFIWEGNNGVAISGNYAYLVNMRPCEPYGVIVTVFVLDVSNPGNPAIVGALGAPGYGMAGEIALCGDYGYVGLGSLGFGIIHISNHTQLTWVLIYITSGFARGVAVSGEHAYVATGESGLLILDVSNPANPFAEGYYDTPGSATRVAVSGNYAFVVDGNAGLRVLNVSDAAHPFEVGYYDAPGVSRGVAISGNYAYVANDNVFEVLDFTDALGVREGPNVLLPWQFALNPPYPNPFNNQTMLGFALPRLFPISLVIYDIEGRQVAVAAAGEYLAGLHRIGFDAGSLSSGVYFARLLAPGFAQTQKMVVIK